MIKKFIIKIKNLFVSKRDILELIKNNVDSANKMFKLIKTIYDNNSKDHKEVFELMKIIVDILNKLDKRIDALEKNNIFRRN